MARYIRPIVNTDGQRPRDALQLAGGWGWFTHVEILERGNTPKIVPAPEISNHERAALTSARPDIAGLSFDRPGLMGIVNVTPDSFSDGGKHSDLKDALAAASHMEAAGADILDIGGESTRPGAQVVDTEMEIQRTAPVIEAIRATSDIAVSIDTRKAPVADAALRAGAGLVNDVAGFTWDADLAPLCAKWQAPVCVMHAQGDPATMQINPQYDDVLLDVYDFLEERIETLISLGIDRHQIIVDPGIGFGKTMAHNLTLLRRISLFHSLGAPILLGASRKKFIGTLSGAHDAAGRDAGSVGVALAALGQGVQIIRAHDVPGHAQAIALWRAAMAHSEHE